LAGRPPVLTDFRLLRELHRSGSGAVFEAEHRPSGERCNAVLAHTVL
jgi:hypothetical protein